MTLRIMPAGHKILIKVERPELTRKIKRDDGEEVELEIASDERLAQSGVDVAEIVEVGPTAWQAFRLVDHNGKEVNGPPWAKKGDKVLYVASAGRFFKHPETGEDCYKIIQDEDIRAVLVEEGE